MARRSGCLGRLAILAVLVVVTAGAGAYWFLGSFQGFQDDAIVEIERGTGTQSIARELTRAGVLRSPYSFLAIHLLQPKAKLQAGEYRFSGAATPWEVFDRMRAGDVHYEEVTVPEGSNIFDIAAILETTETITSKDFLKAATDAGSIHDLDPQAPTLEGFLFPSTYRVTHQTTAEQLCRSMTKEFRKQWTSAGGKNREHDIHAVVTLASLVEKETAIPQERALVAAVFEGRLQKHMMLQCDPTTVYAALLENRYRGTIHKSDLASDNPYNTYTHYGLPPGPIANPGISSLRAALEPAKTDYLYFVARPNGSGSHHFSSTLDEHEKAVMAYRHAAR